MHVGGFARFADALFLSAPLNASSTTHFTATSTFGNLIRIEGTGTSTILGRLSISATSTMAGYKICTQQNKVCTGGAFSSSGGFTTLRTTTDLVGLGTSTPAEKLSVNGGAFFDSDIIRFGSSSAPTLNFRYFASSTSTIPNLTSAFTFATSTTNTPLLTLSTKSSRYGRVGIGTSSPSALFAINTLNSSNQADNLFYIGSSTQNTFIIDNHGNIGIGTSTRSTSKARLGITGFGTGTNRILALADANNVERFTVQENGNVGIGTTTPGARLSINGTTLFDSPYIRYGSSTAPNLNFRYFASSTSTIPNNTTNAWSIATSTAVTPIFSVETTGGGKIGIGTSSPNNTFEVNAHTVKGSNSRNQSLGLFYFRNDNQIENIINLLTDTVSGTTFTFMQMYSDANGTTDKKFNFRGDGTPLSDLAAATPADVAEWTRVVGDPSSYESGDLVMISRDHPRHVEKAIAGKDTEPLLMGAVTLMPGLVGVSFDVADDVTEGIGSKTDEELEKEWNAKKIANIGYAPLKVSMEGGPIQPGNPITASSIPGIGKKAQSGQKIVGYAFDPFDPPNNKMGIHNQDLKMPTYGKFLHAETKPITLPDGTPSYQGWVFGYVNLGYAKLDPSISSGQVTAGWTIDQTTGRLATTYGLDLGGNSIQNVSAIMSASGNWKIDENGKLVVKEVEAEKGRFTKELGVGTPESPQGITIYDEDTGEPYCTKIKGGNSIVLPGKCDDAAPATEEKPTP